MFIEDGEKIYKKFGFDDEIFVFDKETCELFIKEFYTAEVEIMVFNGYLARYNPESNKFVYFHRWLMQKKELLRCRVVHHKNEDKADNRYCNLVSMERQEHEILHGINGKGLSKLNLIKNPPHNIT